MHKLMTTTALATMLLASPVLADGFYVGGETGYGWSNDANIDKTTDFAGGEYKHLMVAPFHKDWSDNLGGSIMGGLSFGYEYSLPPQYGVLRFEIGSNYRPGFEYENGADYSSYDAKEYKGQPKSLSINASKSLQTDVSSLAVMTNLYYDAKQWSYSGQNFSIYPSLGAGLGFARNKVDDVQGKFSYDAEHTHWGHTHNYSGNQDFSIDGESNVSFAWQVMAGAGVDLPQGWSGSLMYRYADLGRVTTGNKVEIGGNSYDFEAIEGDLQVHEIVLGVRKTF